MTENNKDMEPGGSKNHQRGGPDDAFYIGWMPAAPRSFASHVKRLLMILFPVAVLVGALIASFQKKFSTASFEFGTNTEVKGIYFDKPVPMIKVVNEKDIWGRSSFITIPLVGYGKNGAETTIREIEQEKNAILDKREVVLKGVLLYSDGKTLLQVNKAEHPVVSIGKEAGASFFPKQTDEGEQVINGEIIDPKCFFGVMKPGEGKVHRDCAVRCILGGIPPVLKVTGESGQKNYYLMVGRNGEPINKAVQDFVAEPVAVSAKLVRQDDWIVLYVNDNNGIRRIPGTVLARPGAMLMACSPCRE